MPPPCRLLPALPSSRPCPPAAAGRRHGPPASDRRRPAPPRKEEASESELYSRLMDTASEEGDEPPLTEFDSVVRVFSTHSAPDWRQPWQRRRQTSSTSSGFLISGRRLITNAHSVEHSTTVSVQRAGDDRRFLARVLAVGTDADLALLTVDDEAFWQPSQPGGEPPKALALGRLPRLQDDVFVLGFPVGGDSLSVTAGVVSRIEVLGYSHSTAELLCCQIDAAINAGNSGGPCVDSRGDVVGVAFQSMSAGEAEGIGYVVPTPVLAHFLMDIERNGRFTGFPSVGFDWQCAESPALRASLGLPAEPRPQGVLVTRVEPTSSAAAVLSPGDLLVSFNDQPISCDGTVAFRPGERIAFSYVFSQCFVGETAHLGVLRGGAPPQRLPLLLGRHTQLVPPFLPDGQLPSYIVVGGAVFVAATEPHLRSVFGEDFEYEADPHLLLALFEEQATSQDQQCIVLSQLLASRATVGFDDAEVANARLLSLNGAAVLSLAHLATLLEQAAAQPDRRWLEFGLAGGGRLVLDAQLSRELAPAVLQAHGIPAQASADLLPLLKGRTV